VSSARIGWPALLSNGVFRYRATWYVVSYWWTAASNRPRPSTRQPGAAHSVRVAGIRSGRVAPDRLEDLAVARILRGPRGSQEAVMWYSGTAELLMFLFAR